MGRRRSRRRLLVILAAAVSLAILAVVDVASIHPVFASLTDLFWTALFWMLVLVVLALLVWSVFPTPSR